MANDFVYQTATRLAYSKGVSGGEWACQGKFINLIRGLITLDGALISINPPCSLRPEWRALKLNAASAQIAAESWESRVTR